jgi:hypothetical protein
VYYSECFLNGIEPLVADTAALQAQGQFDKWWVERTARINKKTKNHTTNKRNRYDATDEQQVCKKQPKIDESNTNNNNSDDVVNDAKDEEVMSVNVISVATSHNEREQQHQQQQRRHDQRELIPIEQIATLSSTSKSSMEAVKGRLIEDLRVSGGDVDTPDVQQCLEILKTYYLRGHQKLDPHKLQGNWLTISKPTYTECKGKTAKGESLYSLGRIAFDMFKPTNLVFSVQASFNHVQNIDPKNPGRPLHVPRKLMHDIKKGQCRLQSYE